VLVQRVLMPVSGRESWTLLGDDSGVVEPAERYLAYLAAIERSPNTVRAYAVSLKLWFYWSGIQLPWKPSGIRAGRWTRATGSPVKSCAAMMTRSAAPRSGSCTNAMT
jgi:hypothetical protein